MLRIIAGKHRSRKLTTPEGNQQELIRPTKDRAREALFNILQHRLGTFEETRILDAFAGTGALGLECLSRGATHATFMDNSRLAVNLIKQNSGTLNETEKCSILHLDATTPPRAAQPCDLLLLDPPYHRNLAEKALSALSAQGWAQPSTLAAVEIGRDESINIPPDWNLLTERAHAAARFYILEYKPTTEETDDTNEVEELEGPLE